MARFRWGDEENQRMMHWTAWWKMCALRIKEGWVFVIFTDSTW